MKYGLEYRVEWMMMDDVTIVRASIFDTTVLIDDADEVTVIPCTGSGNPLSISIIDSDRDKFKVIKSRQAKIEILTENGINFNTFSGADNRWYVDIRINPDTDNKELFYGYLSLADNQVDFLPDPNVMVLTATDHLGMLKDIPLTNNLGNTPAGKFRIADYLSWMLKKTGLNLPFKIVNNLRHGSGEFTNAITFSASGQYFVTDDLITDYFYVGQRIVITGSASNNGTRTVTAVDNSGLVSQISIDATIVSEVAPSVTFNDESSEVHFYDGVYIDAKTFESEIGECEDCYTVIEKILGKDCYITQYNGEWWIERLTELDDSGLYIANFDADGAFGSVTLSTDYNKSIGVVEDFYMALADMLLQADRPHGVGKLTYNYNYPLEVPCNVDFSRGDFIADLPDETIEGETFSAKSYEIDCWFLKRGIGSSSTTPTCSAYIKRLFNVLDYEVDRYAVLTVPSSSTPPLNYIESEGIELTKKDRFNVNINYAWSSNASGGGVYTQQVAAIRLEGKDGTYWTMDDDGEWFQSDATWATNFKTLQDSWAVNDVDESEFRTKSAESKDLPTTGSVYIMLISLNQNSNSVDDYDIYFNIDFNYIPYINGSYQKYSGQYHKIIREPESYLAKIEDEVYVSDSPKPLLKGGMFIPRIESLFSGSLIFANGTSFNVSGNQTAVFRIGMTIIISGTSNNNITALITSVNYQLIPDATAVGVSVATVFETASATISYYNFILTSKFYDYHIYPTGVAGYIKPYGEHQIRSVFNQYRNANRVFTGSVKGLSLEWCDIIHKYSLTDVNDNTNNRLFVLTTFEQNWKTGFWNGTLIECWNTDGRAFDDEREFKYITQ